MPDPTHAGQSNSEGLTKVSVVNPSYLLYRLRTQHLLAWEQSLLRVLGLLVLTLFDDRLSPRGVLNQPLLSSLVRGTLVHP